jgi:hypothetical protein
MDQSAQVHERFPQCAEADTILPFHVVMEIYLYCLLHGGVYVSRFGANSVDDLEMDPLPEANAVFEFLLCLSLQLVQQLPISSSFNILAFHPSHPLCTFIFTHTH